MKKGITTVITAVMIWILLMALIGIFICFNDILSGSMTRSFRREIKQSTAVQLIETVSVCGKLNGNGNGMNYFGAALVTSDTAEDVDALVAELEEKFENVGSTLQEGTQVNVSYLEHSTLFFDEAAFQDDQAYYCIYYYVHEHPYSNIFDIRGY